MKIYFAGSIRGGRQKAEDYKQLIEGLSQFSTVLTEHIGNSELTNQGEGERTDEAIYKRDVSWIDEADVIVADVTVPSLGVGYEIGYAEAHHKRIICLYQADEGKVSAMIAGNAHVELLVYTNTTDAIQQLQTVLL